MFRKIMSVFICSSLLVACAETALTQKTVVLLNGDLAQSNIFEQDGGLGSSELCVAKQIGEVNGKPFVEFYPACHAKTGETAGTVQTAIQAMTGVGSMATGAALLLNAVKDTNGGQTIIGGSSTIKVDQNAIINK